MIIAGLSLVFLGSVESPCCGGTVLCERAVAATFGRTHLTHWRCLHGPSCALFFFIHTLTYLSRYLSFGPLHLCSFRVHRTIRGRGHIMPSLAGWTTSSTCLLCPMYFDVFRIFTATSKRSKACFMVN